MIKNYLADISFANYQNFRAVFVDVAQRFPKNTALRMRIGNTPDFNKISYTQLLKEIDKIGIGLLKKGFKKGDRIGILSENRLEWALAYIAIVCTGMTVIPFDILYTTKTFATVAAFSDMKALFISAKELPKIQLFKQQNSSMPLLIPFDNEKNLNSTENIFFWKNLTDQDISKKDKELLSAPLDIAPDDIASVIFTSGTTGNPKGVMLTHRGIIANIEASILSLPIDEHDNFIAVLPFHHTYPTTCSLLSPLTVGGSVTIVQSLVGKVILRDIKETDGTIVICVPLLLDKIGQGIERNLRKASGTTGVIARTLLGLSKGLSRPFKERPGRTLMHAIRDKAGLSSVRLLVAGGGPLSPATACFFNALGMTVRQGYGMSENGPLISTNTIKYNNYKSVGLPVKDTIIKIDNPDASGIGAILVSSPSLMKGYFRNPEATKEIINQEGFITTGDLGRFDKQGFLYITGRHKNIIVTPAGKNVYPEEIEIYFNDSDIIDEVLVVGRPKGKNNRGEEVIAGFWVDRKRIAEQEGISFSDEELIKRIKTEVSLINRKLESYKKIIEISLKKDEFEKTSSKKIKRFLYNHENIGQKI